MAILRNPRLASPGRASPGHASKAAALGPVVIAAGGTAGHVFPAAALSQVLGARGIRSVVLTDRRAALHDFGAAERHVIAGSGFAGRGLLRVPAALMATARGTLAAWRLMKDLRPAAVIGFGGYPSLAPVFAARLLRPRPIIVLHEQNAVLGRANRALAPLADRIAVSFAATRHAPAASIVTGNPVRPAVTALVERCGAAPKGKQQTRLLVLGGSLGARALADLVPDALAELSARDRLRVAQQCRAEDLARVEGRYDAAGIAAELAAFFADLPERMAWADLVIARAGASTIAELSAIGRPSILIPLPGAIDDHQRANAAALTAAGGAVMLEQAGLTSERLRAAVAGLLDDPGRLRQMADAARQFGRPQAGEELADLVLATIAGDGRTGRGSP
ncbi:MAG: undecaprenyldiphospho-muramoylpentapeptide beta-N-acetylglucosaminyltransferase [Acetobacteraceae bacterium]